MNALPSDTTSLAPDRLWSEEAELVVLGTCLSNHGIYDAIEGRLTAKSFYTANHQAIFSAISSLAARGESYDLISVAVYLEGLPVAHPSRHKARTIIPINDKEVWLDRIGGMPVLMELANNHSHSRAIEAYADVVADYSLRRNAIRLIMETQSRLLQPAGDTTHSIVSKLEADITKLSLGMTRGDGMQDITTLMHSAVDLIEKRFHEGTLITGTPTPWDRFNLMTGGLQKGDLILVAGRPSMGKTAFAMNIAEHVSIEKGLPALVYSYEQPAEQLTLRLFSAMAKIDHDKLKRGDMADHEWESLSSAMTRSAGRSLFVQDRRTTTIHELAFEARAAANKMGRLGLIVVDYIGLIPMEERKDSNRSIMLGEISRRLKILAQELECPVIALSQLNRSLESRADKRPMMSDLRESGNLEQDADLIIFLYRDEVYYPDTIDDHGAEIIIGKQRNGPIGRLPFTFVAPYLRYEETYEPFLPSWDRGSAPAAAKGKKKFTEEL